MTPEDIADLEQHEAQVAALIARIESERDAALAASARDRAARNRGRTERDRLRRELAAFVPPGTLAPGETPALCPTCTEVPCVPGLPGCARCVAAEVERLRAERTRTVDALSDVGRTAEAARGDLEDGINAEMLSTSITIDVLQAERDRLAEQVQRVKAVRAWRNEDGRMFVFADDLRAALDGEVPAP